MCFTTVLKVTLSIATHIYPSPRYSDAILEKPKKTSCSFVSDLCNGKLSEHTTCLKMLSRISGVFHNRAGHGKINDKVHFFVPLVFQVRHLGDIVTLVMQLVNQVRKYDDPIHHDEHPIKMAVGYLAFY